MTKHVVISGANRGIGLELVRHYLKRDLKVTACCRKIDSQDQLHQLLDNYSNLSIRRLDVTCAESISEFSASIDDSSVDLLINNAGYYGPKGYRLGETDVDEWLKVLQINTIAPLKVVEALLPKLNTKQPAVIACISSKMGSMADNTSGGSYIYRSSKAALNAVVKSLALDLNSMGVSCIALHPGWVQTDMGGPNALITTKESVAGMTRVLEDLTIDQSGQFINYDGQPIPW
ncbi:SDR family oxidoreductase [Shewanella waksmanii]|uniref:SDR family oxidoreductase n=1 Tax=Shewanella waksmanii TaxID=213783 RepID=UPI003736A924